MELIIWVIVLALAVALAYNLQFSSETLAMGRALSDTDSKTGFEDAISPPWQTNLALILFGCIVSLGVLAWWRLGWVSAVVSLAIILVGGGLLKSVFSKVLAGHYRRLIIHSMIARYADYARDGDGLRADAMKQLLLRVGIDPDAM